MERQRLTVKRSSSDRGSESKCSEHSVDEPAVMGLRRCVLLSYVASGAQWHVASVPLLVLRQRSAASLFLLCVRWGTNGQIPEQSIKYTATSLETVRYVEFCWNSVCVKIDIRVLNLPLSCEKGFQEQSLLARQMNALRLSWGNRQVALAGIFLILLRICFKSVLQFSS